MEAEPAAAVPPSADDGCQLVEWSTVAGEADFLISQCPDDEVVNSQLLRGLQTGRGLRLCTAKSLGVSAVDDLIQASDQVKHGILCINPSPRYFKNESCVLETLLMTARPLRSWVYFPPLQRLWTWPKMEVLANDVWCYLVDSSLYAAWGRHNSWSNWPDIRRLFELDVAIFLDWQTAVAHSIKRENTQRLEWLGGVLEAKSSTSSPDRAGGGLSENELAILEDFATSICQQFQVLDEEYYRRVALKDKEDLVEWAQATGTSFPGPSERLEDGPVKHHDLEDCLKGVMEC
eukprot:TRINITY_DN38147_c0_g1_i4.p1 TRINITY_DN38147_c0_g1~~TRINITY_DN38147_c0_g1_i4.p1  ORF type:complete len:290 (+),score=45.08 TRINITY_DN38147_c0_g1_i4:78-947(+)